MARPLLRNDQARRALWALAGVALLAALAMILDRPASPDQLLPSSTPAFVASSAPP